MRPGRSGAPADERIGTRLLGSDEAYRFASIIVLTNAPAATQERLRTMSPFSGALAPRPLEVMGPRRLEQILERRPGVCRLVPSLLGVRDPSALLNLMPGGAAAWDVDSAVELARVFVPTNAYHRTVEVLDQHNFAVLTGPPEMGKTAIARIVGLALQAEGWEVYECIRPEQVWTAYNRDREQLFVADDAFGSTEFLADAADRWADELPRLLEEMDGRHKLIWTSRPAPLKAGLSRIHREHGLTRFPRPAEITVDAASLEVEEKATILFRHAAAVGLGADAIEILRRYGGTIVLHPHFTPERIKRFVRTRLSTLDPDLAWSIELEIDRPTEAMAASYGALADEHRAILVGLVDGPPGPMTVHDLTSSARRHAPEGLPRSPSELIDRLTDQFIRLVPPASVSWAHPSWRDLVIEHLAADAAVRQAFLERCSLDGVLLALSSGGGRDGKRTLPLLVSDEDWDSLTDRILVLVPELADPDLFRLIAALDHGLVAHRGNAELEALATLTLRAIASVWERTDVYASPTLVDRWVWLARILPQSSELEIPDVQLWDPPAGEHFRPPPREHSALPEPVTWEEDTAVTSLLIRRILADLAAD
ncbi:MAG TPA: hypothetical protein VGM80_00985 [Gaiellaceae bacterium]